MQSKGDRALSRDGIEPDDYPLQPKVILHISAPADTVWKALEVAFTEVCGSAAKYQVDTARRTVVARTKRKVDVSASRVEASMQEDSGRVRVLLASRPTFWTQTVDFGENYRLTALIIKKLEMELGVTNVQQSRVVEAA
jgi:hypothetical protein